MHLPCCLRLLFLILYLLLISLIVYSQLDRLFLGQMFYYKLGDGAIFTQKALQIGSTVVSSLLHSTLKPRFSVLPSIRIGRSSPSTSILIAVSGSAKSQAEAGDASVTVSLDSSTHLQSAEQPPGLAQPHRFLR